MTRWLLAVLCISSATALAPAQTEAPPNPSQRVAGKRARRVVILKVDGLNADLLQEHMSEVDSATGKSPLPWLQYIFGEHGTIFDNFYTRGISLSAPSWSMLDTGRHTVIRGNAEYDRYTGEVYDYLNFFPFYIGYARQRQVDMPGVEVLDRAGIPLVIDAFPYADLYQSFQLYQRGVRWMTLQHALKRRFSSKVMISTLENASGPSFDEVLARETEQEIDNGLSSDSIVYLDFFTGDIDHEGHATNEPAALLSALKHLDGLAGRLWAHVQKSQLANETLFVMVSDHGMNNAPRIFSQGFSLPDLFNSPEGGGHHVVTNRHQLENFKLLGLNPLVHRVITPSTASFYLPGQASRYPTAWLDLDGNERASVGLRNSDLNRIHILLLQLARPELAKPLRVAAIAAVRRTIDKHRLQWTKECEDLEAELNALQTQIAERKLQVHEQPRKWSSGQKALGEDKAARRMAQELSAWEQEEDDYRAYLTKVQALLKLDLNPERPFTQKIADLIPEMSLGDQNTVASLQRYLVGPSAEGLVLDLSGNIDDRRSFRYVNNFALLAAQRSRNNPQRELSASPIDFSALRLPDGAIPPASHSYWLYGDEENELLIMQDVRGEIKIQPAKHLTQKDDGAIAWTPQEWRADLPLHLFEDADLTVPPGQDRAAWLSAWHSERDWYTAIHRTKYSNGVIGITEQFSPVGDNVPGRPGESATMLSYERHRRELVQPDFQVFASDHWNFNVRNVNPGGNHGSFLRISTHSVWMMAGAGMSAVRIEEPYDSLNFASTVLSLAGKTPPLPERVVRLQ